MIRKVPRGTPVENPRDNAKNIGLTWVGLLMRSRDPTGKCGKIPDFSIFVYLSGLTSVNCSFFYEGADTYGNTHPLIIMGDPCYSRGVPNRWGSAKSSSP